MKKFTSMLLALAMVMTLMPMNIMAASQFSDVKDTDYYSEAAEALADADILAGYEDGTFKAVKSITRAEMAAIICRMIEKEADAEDAEGKTDFDDVKANHWASGYINIASKEGIINGDGNGKFRPEDNVKYEEALKMVVCALGLGNKVTVNPDDWSAGYIKLADDKGITENLKGSKGKASTRGDVAVMVFNGMASQTSAVAAPTASLKAGKYRGLQYVKLSADSGAKIYYTTNGTDPTTKSKKYEGTSILISQSCELKAIAVVNGVQSEVMSAEYELYFLGGSSGGSSRPAPATPVPDVTYTVSFNLNYDGATGAPENQKIKKGECATMPENPERDGFSFVGWFVDKNETDLSKYYDFSTSVEADVVLFAKWIDMTDTDNDGLVDGLEELYGTDKTKTDTDEDGLSDYVEVITLALDPLKVDTDDNGINDSEEDFDGDGITNKNEITNGTDPASKDTDMDGLDDNEEITYNTDPTKEDTDDDGVSDGKEIELGTDPLTAQTTFSMNVSADNDGDGATASVQMDLSGEQVETLSVEPVNNDTFFPETMPGYMGKAYDFNVEGDFTSATINFEFDASALGPDADPVIYYFNEETQDLEELETTINGNVASAQVTHFSKYILVDRKIYEESFEWIDVWDSTKNYTGVEIVLVIDDSGSMQSNDRSNQRLSVASSLIDKLPQNSKVGVVKFESGTTILTENLTDNKDTAKSYLNTAYFHSYGGTMMYNAINNAFNLFKSTDESIMKVMVVLSDGDTGDTSRHSSTISFANDNNIKIYTVGLGNSTSYFNNYLKPLATNTAAAFYLASDANQLAGIYDNISQKIDLDTDSDDDDIPDYYEDNMIIFSGVKLKLDKNNADTDGDGIPDGEEIKIKKEPSPDGNQVIVTGKIVLGDPTKKDTDGDGTNDKDDIDPFMWNVNARDLAILSQAVYSRNIPLNVKFEDLDDSVISDIDNNFHNTASIKEMKGWKLAFYYRDTQNVTEDETYGGYCYGLFVNDDNAVLVFRGSVGNQKTSIKDKRGDWYRNYFVYSLTDDPDGQRAESTVQTICRSSLITNKSFYLTGHSRGGMLAQRAGVALVSNNLDSRLERLVYYNGMGVIFNDMDKEQVKKLNQLRTIKNKIDFHSIKGDVVSILGAHPVDLKYQYPMVDCAKKNHESFNEHYLCNFTAQIRTERYSGN